MAINPTYPGVYIQEIPSGVRTLTGVATSVTAFIGRAQRGPVNEPMLISSFADFERTFGGLWIASDMSYAVSDFFLNGGGQAIIVRLYHAEDTGDGRALVTLGPEGEAQHTLKAAHPGAWGNNLRASIDHLTAEDLPPAEKAAAFNLTLVDLGTGNEEKFRNVLVGPTWQMHPRYLPAVLDNRSNLARMTAAGTARPSPSAEVVFASGADGVALVEADYRGSAAAKTGLYALEKTDIFNLLCIPDSLALGPNLTGDAVAYCEKRRAVMIIDPRPSWQTVEDVENPTSGIASVPVSANAAIYFPRLMQPDPLRDNQIVARPPCGAIAGVIARTDGARGIWKAPAGLDAYLNGVPKLGASLTDFEVGRLNPKGVNCLKTMPAAGRVVWGARTRKGDDQLSSEWKYIPIRRLALYIEESLYRGTQWVVFEPNDEPLWAQIRLNVGSFMNDLFRKGAFFGNSPADSYFVKCDKETTTQADINLGIVNIVVGFAPLKPAEFVIIKLQQMAGQLAA
jgi:phage tail sheath protein FI